MPAGYDAEVAELFRDLRAATALTEMDLAARLGTRAEVVQSLEQGALYALPPWAETCRVVNAYGALLNLDVRPLLRRIYAQLEAGIVELQPKHMPDVPMMTPPAEPQDYSFTPSNAGGAPAPNPLDIPWPPPAQQAPPPPQRNAWPNGPTAPAQQPQAPWQHAQPQPQPQHAWPNPQSPQQQPQAWPGNPPAPQAPRPNPQPQPQRQAQPQMQPQPADRRPPQPRAPQPQAPQPQPQPQARPQPLPSRPAPPPEPHPLDADFGESVPLQAAPEPEKPKRRVGLLKWGLGALVISIVAFGLWMTLTHAPDPSGVTGSGAPSGTIDPDDPRSRKADRLPSPPGG